MEALMVLGCAALIATSTFTLAGWEATQGVSTGRRLARRIGHAVSRCVDALASTPVVAALVTQGSVEALCDHVSESLARHGRTDVTREQACSALLLCTCLAALLCALASASPIGLALVPACCAAGVPAWDASRRRREAQELAAEMPGVFRSLAMALGAGETLAQAIEYVGTHGKGPAGRSFMRAALRVRCGTSVDEALRALAGELDTPGVGLLVTALLVSQRTGSPLRGLLEYSASLAERAREFERMLVVKTAQVRLSVRIVCLLPALMLAGLSLLSADFRQGLATAPGMACVFVATLMDLTALAIIRRLMRGVL